MFRKDKPFKLGERLLFFDDYFIEVHPHSEVFTLSEDEFEDWEHGKYVETFCILLNNDKCLREVLAERIPFDEVKDRLTIEVARFLTMHIMPALEQFAEIVR